MKAKLAAPPAAWIAAAVFFLATWALAWHPPGVWNSPDEMANAFWSERVARGEPLQIRDVVVGLGAGAVHPRSVAVVGDALVPGSFPGLYLLYGTLNALVRLPFEAATPLFTALAGPALGAVVARLFDRRVGAWTAVLFFLHPAVIYYSARGLFHNVLFVDLVVFAAAFLVLRPFKRLFGSREILDDVLGGFLLGWAVVTRASEALWLVPAGLAFLPFAGPERWKRLLAAAAGAALPLFIFLQINSAVFGAPFRTGYVAPPPAAGTAMLSSDAVASDASASDDFLTGEGGTSGIGERLAGLLPFGLHPRNMLRHGAEYGFGIFWWFSLLGVAGLVAWSAAWRKTPSVQRAHLGVAALVAAWLVAFYGSWYLRDHVDPSRVTIGTSYARYFLPAYVAALPWVAIGLLRISEAAGRRSRAVLIVTVAAVAILSLRVAVFSGDESMRAVRATLAGNALKRSLLLKAVPEDAVIMTERFDKVFFPERLRFLPKTDEASFAAAETLANYVPVYWYGLEPSGGEFAALQLMAERHGFTLLDVGGPVEGEALFQLMSL